MKGQEEARPPRLSLSSPTPLFILCTSVWVLGVFPACAAGGRPQQPVTPPQGGEAGREPARSQAGPSRGGEGDRTGSKRREPAEELQAAGACPGGGELGWVRAPAPRALQVEPSFPAESAGEGHRLPEARPPSPGCAVAPRPWLRAGGGRTRRKN